MSTVGDNIKRMRKAANISQNGLAKMAGIAKATLSAIERSTKNPSVETVKLLAVALDCTTADLMGESPKKEKAQETPVDPLRASVIRDYDRLPPEARRLVRQYIDLLGKR